MHHIIRSILHEPYRMVNIIVLNVRKRVRTSWSAAFLSLLLYSILR